MQGACLSLSVPRGRTFCPHLPLLVLFSLAVYIPWLIQVIRSISHRRPGNGISVKIGTSHGEVAQMIDFILNEGLFNVRDLA